jgi:hypothetical protein
MYVICWFCNSSLTCLGDCCLILLSNNTAIGKATLLPQSECSVSDVNPFKAVPYMLSLFHISFVMINQMMVTGEDVMFGDTRMVHLVIIIYVKLLLQNVIMHFFIM